MKTPNLFIAASAVALAVAIAPAARAADAPAQSNEVPVTSDNQFWYRIQPYSHDPFINKANNPSKGADINKQMVHFEHTDTGGLIWNSFTMTGLFSDYNERSASGVNGAKELYSTYRGDISATGFGRPPITLPGVADVQFEFGGDLNYKDDDYGARRKFLLIGPNFVIDAPGSVTFAVHFAKEFNHNALPGVGRDIEFHPTWNTEFSYTEYFDEAHLVRLEGAFNMTGAKGKDYIPVSATSGALPVKTVTEFYTYNTIILDAGQLLKMPPHKLDVFAGVQYWVHKFGYPSKNDGGAIEFTPYVGVGVHF